LLLDPIAGHLPSVKGGNYTMNPGKGRGPALLIFMCDVEIRVDFLATHARYIASYAIDMCCIGMTIGNRAG
jgi:hypothetical protein